MQKELHLRVRVTQIVLPFPWWFVARKVESNTKPEKSSDLRAQASSTESEIFQVQRFRQDRLGLGFVENNVEGTGLLRI